MFSAIRDPRPADLTHLRASGDNRGVYAHPRSEATERKRIETNLRATTLLLQAVSAAQLDFAGGKEVDVVLANMLRAMLHAIQAQQAFLREEPSADLVYEPAQVSVAAGAYEAALGFAALESVADSIVCTPRTAAYSEAAEHTGLLQANDSALSYIGLPLTLPQTPNNETALPDQATASNSLLGVLVIAGRAGHFTADILALLQPVVATSAQLLIAHRSEKRRRAAELALAEERARFAQHVAKRTSELEHAVHAKDEFVATMNHEMRTPLHALLLYADSLQAPQAAPLNERQQRAVGCIRESANHLLLLINDVLDVAKMDAGRLSLDVKLADIDELCQSSLRLVTEMARKKQIELAFENRQTLTNLEGDERRIKQMLVNLLSNAVKFTPEGGMVALEVSADDPHDTVLFSVWDTGTGIAPDDIKQLFRPFVQLKNSRGCSQSGSGLGLFLVARMCELHGGRVSVTSELGKGSRFTVSLPRHQPQGAVTCLTPQI